MAQESVNENGIQIHIYTHTHTWEFSSDQRHFKLVGINKLVGEGAGSLTLCLSVLGWLPSVSMAVCYVANKTCFRFFLRT